MPKRKEVWNYTRKRKRGRKAKKNDEDSSSRDTSNQQRTPSPRKGVRPRQSTTPPKISPVQSSSPVKRETSPLPVTPPPLQETLPLPKTPPLNDSTLENHTESLNDSISIKQEPISSPPKPKRLCVSTSLMPAFGMLESEKVQNTEVVKVKNETPESKKSSFKKIGFDEDEVMIIEILKPVKKTIHEPVLNWNEDIVVVAETLIQKEPEVSHDPIAELLHLPKSIPEIIPSSITNETLTPEEVEYNLLLKMLANDQEEIIVNNSSSSLCSNSDGNPPSSQNEIIYSTGVWNKRSESVQYYSIEELFALELHKYFNFQFSDAEWQNSLEIVEWINFNMEKLKSNNISKEEILENIPQFIQTMSRAQRNEQVQNKSCDSVPFTPSHNNFSTEIKTEKLQETKSVLHIDSFYNQSSTINKKCNQKVISAKNTHSFQETNRISALPSHNKEPVCINHELHKNSPNATTLVKVNQIVGKSRGVHNSDPQDSQKLRTNPSKNFNHAPSSTSSNSFEPKRNLNDHRIAVESRKVNINPNCMDFRNESNKNYSRTFNYTSPSTPPLTYATSEQTNRNPQFQIKNFTNQDADDFLNKTFSDISSSNSNCRQPVEYPKYDHYKTLQNEPKTKKINLDEYYNKYKTKINDPRLRKRTIDLSSQSSSSSFLNNKYSGLMIPGLEESIQKPASKSVEDILNSMNIPELSSQIASVNVSKRGTDNKNQAFKEKHFSTSNNLLPISASSNYFHGMPSTSKLQPTSNFYPAQSSLSSTSVNEHDSFPISTIVTSRNTGKRVESNNFLLNRDKQRIFSQFPTSSFHNSMSVTEHYSPSESEIGMSQLNTVEYNNNIPGISRRLSDNSPQSSMIEEINSVRQNFITQMSPVADLNQAQPNITRPLQLSNSAVTRSTTLVPNSLKEDVGVNLVSSSSVYFLIIEWSVDWFSQYESINHIDSSTNRIQHPPPILPKGIQLSQVRNSYKDYKDYYNTYFKLLLMECWYKTYLSWKESTRRRENSGKIINHETRDEFIKYVMEFFIPNSENESILNENDLVLLRFTTQSEDSVTMLGYVTRSFDRNFDQNCDMDNEAFKILNNRNYSNIKKYKVTIYTVYKFNDFDSEKLVFAKKLFNIRKILQQNDALCYIQRSPLREVVLSPITSNYKFSFDLKSASKEERGHILNQVTNRILDKEPLLALVNCTSDSTKLNVFVNMIIKLKKHKPSSKVIMCTKSENALSMIACDLFRFDVKPVFVGNSKILVLQRYSLKKKAEMLIDKKEFHGLIEENKMKAATTDVLKKSDVFLMTISSFHESLIALRGHDIICCLMDEAHACSEPESIIPLYLGTKKFILFGNKDTLCDVSPITTSYEFNRSLFNRALL